MDKPILFSTPMIQAILDGRKTQTRRVLRHQPPNDVGKLTLDWYYPIVVRDEQEEPSEEKIFGAYDDDGVFGIKCPYKVGDKLWVRETWRPYSESSVQIEYKADGKIIEYPDRPSFEFYGCGQDWRPSIFMPRWASRITMEVVNIRVERLQEISKSDCLDEGCKAVTIADAERAKYWYQELWNSINGKKHPWESNPWVWVITFKVVKNG